MDENIWKMRRARGGSRDISCTIQKDSRVPGGKSGSYLLLIGVTDTWATEHRGRHECFISWGGLALYLAAVLHHMYRLYIGKANWFMGLKGRHSLLSTPKRLSYPTAASSITAKRLLKWQDWYPLRIELERAVRVFEERVTRGWGRCKMWRTST